MWVSKGTQFYDDSIATHHRRENQVDVNRFKNYIILILQEQSLADFLHIILPHSRLRNLFGFYTYTIQYTINIYRALATLH
jgi:hypothetical protein